MSDYDNLKRLGGCKPKPPEVRFAASYVPEPNSGCWLWLGTERGSNGYGGIKVNGKPMAAHRYSWELANGPVPIGMLVCHRCDVPACVNPAHLFLGTHQDNADDKVSKGRQVKGDKWRAAALHLVKRGEDRQDAKLTWSTVRSIRADCRPQRKIAADYSISQNLVSRVKNHKTWKEA